MRFYKGIKAPCHLFIFRFIILQDFYHRSHVYKGGGVKNFKSCDYISATILVLNYRK